MDLPPPSYEDSASAPSCPPTDEKQSAYNPGYPEQPQAGQPMSEKPYPTQEMFKKFACFPM